MGIDGDVELVISAAILHEVRRVLREKFEWSAKELDWAEWAVRRAAKEVAPSPALEVIERDRTDNKIVECAVGSESDYIVTGDRDLLD